MNYLRQTGAILTVLKLKAARDMTEPLEQFLFPVIIAFCVVFLPNIEGGADLLAIYLPWAFSGYVRQMFVDVVNDRKNKHREYFKINGLNRFSYYFAYFVSGTLRVAVISSILCVGFIFSKGSQLPVDHLFVIFFILLLNGMTVTFASFAVSVFFEDPFIGSDIIGTIYSLMGFFYFVGTSFPGFGIKFVCGLLPPAGVTLSTMGTSGPAFGVWDGLLVLSVDFIIYFIIFFLCDTLYGLESEHTRRYWFSLCQKRQAANASHQELDESQSLIEEDENSAPHYEAYNAAGTAKTVQVQGLKKSYGDIEIIKGVSFSMYEKQIFCLLGHNGAGKTTTINVLTAFTDSNAGSIKYFGKDFKAYFNEIKDKIGVCPQTDLCFPFMSCEENLRMIANIRCVPKGQVDDEINDQLMRVGLVQDKHKLASQLSGGNRRKLSLAMALLGGTQILYFDEPTSAMDPASRRIIWSIIKELKQQGKTIILTTHYLEEADELADRIGVMSKGQLFAVGSPNFIKRNFGVGYHVFISPKFGHDICKVFQEKKEGIIQLVQSKIPQAALVPQTANDVIKLCLPFSEQQKFAELFREIEKEDGLQLNLEMNSLEDAFLNITIEEEKKHQAQASALDINTIPASINKKATYNYWMQLKACFMKRYLMTIRSPQGYFSIIQPLAFIFTAVIIPKAILDPSQQLVSFSAFLCVGFTANTSIYCGGSVYDREKKTKYAMRVMGCKNSAYWIGTFLFDFSIILCFVIFLVLMVQAQNITFATHDWMIFLLLTLSFVSATVTIAYFWGFLYKTAIEATSTYPVIALLFLYLLPFIFQTVLQVEGLVTLSIILQVVGFTVGPCLAFQQGLFALNPEAQGGFNKVLIQSPWFYVGLLTTQATIYMIMTIVIENNKFNVKMKDVNAREAVHADDLGAFTEDIEVDLKRLLSPDNKDPIKVRDLRKVYKNGNVAIDNLSFGVEKGQIFGLLGPNGAGKSTTFNIITQLISRSGGKIELNGKSIDQKDKFDIYRDCGVCPQFDPLWELLTVKEHIEIFGLIKGLSGAELQENVDYYLDILHIRQHMNKRTYQLSGGNKRRLCVALSSIGAPSLQFMDEPSTGLDPLARYYLWDTIKQTMAMRNSSIILTTHSMPEAESLCGKIGIMINGRFVCVGNTQYLKNKYGKGYKITLSRGPNCTGDMGQYMKEISAKAEFLDEDGSDVYETYQIPTEDFYFSKAFEKLEQMKKEEIILDFSIYHTTLENVFLDFSKHQRLEAEPGKKIMMNRKRRSSLAIRDSIRRKAEASKASLRSQQDVSMSL